MIYEELTILLIEDHPIIIEAYKGLLVSLKPKAHLKFFVSHNCKEAVEQIISCSNNSININVAIIDIGLPAYKEFENGSDIAILLKQNISQCKIVVLTAFTEPLTIYNLIQNIKIEALLCKSDLDYKKFRELLLMVLNNKTYISKTIKDKITEISINKFDLDQYDIEILNRLQKGIKTVELPKYINLSLSTIEKRKANLKNIFLKNGGTDKVLIEKVKNLGMFN